MKVFKLEDRETRELTFEGVPVSQSNPCPICTDIHKTQGWCLIDNARKLVICPRVESERKIGEAGWLHTTDGSAFASRKRFVVSIKHPDVPLIDFEESARKYAAHITNSQIDWLSRAITISPKTLMLFGVGHDGKNYTFPMWSGHKVVGIRLRTAFRKFCVTGSRLGLFKPNWSHDDRGGDLFICEGESDAASLYDKGLMAVGRPGCKLAVAECVDMARGRDVVVARDNDDVGREGAKMLLESVSKVAKSACMIAPPNDYKDFREWLSPLKNDSYEVLALVKARRGW